MNWRRLTTDRVEGVPAASARPPAAAPRLHHADAAAAAVRLRGRRRRHATCPRPSSTTTTRRSLGSSRAPSRAAATSPSSPSAPTARRDLQPAASTAATGAGRDRDPTPGRSAALERGQTVPIGIVVDGADSKTASVASGYAAQIIAEFNQRQLGLADARGQQGPGIDSRVRVVFNPSLKAVNAMIPGLISDHPADLDVRDHEPGGRARAGARHARADAGHAADARRVPARQGDCRTWGSRRSRSSFVALIGRYWFRVPFNGNVAHGHRGARPVHAHVASESGC